MSRKQLRIPGGKVVTVLDSVEDVCPFCGGTYTLADGPDPSVLHTLPACPQYNDMTALGFLIAARRLSIGPKN